MKNLLEKVGTRFPQLLVDNVLRHMDNMYTTMGKPIEEALPLKQENLEIQDDALSTWTCNIAYVLAYLS
jgi:hypothetical protein